MYIEEKHNAYDSDSKTGLSVTHVQCAGYDTLITTARKTSQFLEPINAKINIQLMSVAWIYSYTAIAA